MTTTTVVVAGLCLLLIAVAGVVILWVIDARRAEHVAADAERVEGQPPGQRPKAAGGHDAPSTGDVPPRQ